MVKIESRFDIKTQEYIILWNDVSTAFKNPLHVRNEGALVPFLTDENFEPCKPLRIRAHPSIVLDVILESPENTLGSRVADTIHPESTIIDSQIRGNSSTPQHRVGGVEDTGTLISNLLGLPPQYTREDVSVNSITSRSNRVIATNTNTDTPGADILRNTAAEGGHDYERGLEYYYGKGVPVDYNVAMEWFKEAAGQGHVAAQYYLGFMFENGYGAAQDPAIAVSWYTKAGAKGYDNDNRNADMVQGNSLGRLAKALKWYRGAADRGDAKAQCILGFMYQYGKGSIKNHRSAREWYTKAVNQGYDNAQNNLGIMCASGEGGAKNYSEALELFFKAGFQGHARAQSNLGLSYESGLGVAYDPIKAAEWYIKSANQGSARSQYRLGTLYLEGDGVQSNIPKGLDLIRKSAIQGNASAQNKLGNMYYHGEGVQRNPSIAREWWDRSAKQGNASANSNLQKFP
ncbi:hypothetical protein BGX26_007221 [Mortierella sp. AD094]|nr:hypothetical protein BGX26_007221 [Mortierella sp. AD094]